MARSRTALLFVVAIAAFGFAAPPAEAAQHCGMLVHASIKLHKNLHCSSGNGLVILAPDVTVNPGGHTISSSSGTDVGINTGLGNQGVVVRNRVRCPLLTSP
jgi:hypothetical protein